MSVDMFDGRVILKQDTGGLHYGRLSMTFGITRKIDSGPCGVILFE